MVKQTDFDIFKPLFIVLYRNISIVVKFFGFSNMFLIPIAVLNILLTEDLDEVLLVFSSLL